MAFDTSRLYSTLLTSRIQSDNPALYQVIYQLIGALSSLAVIVNGSSGGSSSGDDSIIEQNIYQIIQGSREGSGGNSRVIPGPAGRDGTPGTIGATGPAGAIGIVRKFVESYPRYIPIMGNAGQQGTTGAQGPIGPFIPSRIIDDSRRTIQIFQGSSSSGNSKFVNSANFQTGTGATGTTKMPMDNSKPQITEGDEYMTLAYTPSNAANKLKIDIVGEWSPDVANWITAALFQDSTVDALAAEIAYMGVGTGGLNIKFTHYMTAGTTSSTTFRVRAGQHTAAGTTLTFNGESGNQRMGGVMASSITITETLP